MNTDATEGEAQTQEQAQPEQWDDPLANEEGVQTALKNLLTEYAGEEKWPRRTEVVEARLQRFFERGDQYVYWNAAKFIFATVTQGLVVGSSENAADMPRYMDVYNIFAPFEETIIALLSQNPPGVAFDPDDPLSTPDIDAAHDAEILRHEVDRATDRKKLQTQIVRYFCTDGRTVILSDLDEDGKPVMYPYGVLEHKCPLTARCQEDMPYQIISEEMHIDMAKYENPWTASKIEEGGSAPGESNYERLARLGAMQGTKMMMQSGDAWKHLVTRQRAWLRPCAYIRIPEDIREKVKTLFPDGLRVTFIGGAYCGAKTVSMDQQLVIRHPTPGDGMNRPSLMKKFVPVQRAYNDYRNLEKEIHDYTQPRTFMACDAQDIEALREQVSEPGNTVPFELPSNLDDIRKAIFTEPPSHADATLIEAYNDLVGSFGQFITGCYPALFGGDTKANDTASGISTQRDQSMMRQGIPWGALQEMFARAYEQMVKMMAESADEGQTVNVAVPDKRGQTSVVEVDLSALKNGSFKAYPDVDSSFPETTGSKKQAWQALMIGSEKNPALASIVSLPENQELAKQWNGLEEVVIPGAEAMEKQYSEIDDLLKSRPVPPPASVVMEMALKYRAAAKVAAMAGQPAPPPPDPMAMLKPSVQIQPEDFHNFEYQACQDWLSSKECRDELKKGNAAGVLNVRLHARLHQQAMQQNQQPQGKPPSVAINYANLPPEGQVQAAAEAGIKINPPQPQPQPQAEPKGMMQ